MNDEHPKRRFTRFKPDKNTLSWFCADQENFEPDHVGLTTSEAHGGAGFIFVGDLPVVIGQYIIIQTGELAPIRAQVRWIKPLGEGISHIGIQYIE